MSFVSRFLRVTLLCTAVLAFVVPGTASASIDDTIQKSFTVDSGGTLDVDTDKGSIEVRGTTGRTVEIKVVRKVKTADREKAQKILDNFKIDFKQSGKDIFITGERGRKESIWDKIWNRLNVKYTISVPEIYNVELKTSGGSISVENLEGEVNIKTSGGSLNLEKITGPVWGKTSGGSIRVGEVDGDVDINTSGGSIQIEGARGSIKAHTSGGSINVQEVMGSINADTSGGSIKASISRQPQTDCRLTTSGGSITVYLAGDIAVDLDASTSGGGVYTESPVTIQGKINKSKLKSKINGGGPLLYLHTSGGSIYIKTKIGDY
ncbi:DUF4097 family beta strand repeat protein [bacterium]|nr:DUF4097 family beta strand repeat protein [bacterium]